MTITELPQEYENQYKALSTRLDAMKPLLSVYRGEDLVSLRRKIKIYYDMACECRRTASMLFGYYEEDVNNDRFY